MSEPSVTRLTSELAQARTSFERSKRELEAACERAREIGLDHPDGARALHNGASGYRHALEEYTTAPRRLSASILSGRPRQLREGSGELAGLRQSFRLKKETIATTVGSDGMGTAIQIPAGAEITVVDNFPKNNTNDPRATINVFWRGEILAMFLIDLQERGEPLE
jgi:hypothetical protein